MIIIASVLILFVVIAFIITIIIARHDAEIRLQELIEYLNNKSE